MKKFLALILALCMVFALAACGQAAAPAAAAPAE
jgi:predicted small lipoprotein YifL